MASESRAARRSAPDIDESTRRLVELGLTINEARCYAALLRIAPATAGELADASGVPRPKVYVTLKTLEQRSFCYGSGDPVTKFRAVDPELALTEWARTREHDRRLADQRDRELCGELVALLPEPPERVTEDPSQIMRLTGAPDPTIEVFEQLIERAERRVDIVQSVPVFQRQARWNVCEIEALGRGVRVRVLFSSRELAADHRYEELLGAGAEVRLARNEPLKLVVRDGVEGIVALHNPGDDLHPTCVEMRHADLVAPIQLLFNREWRRAKPLALPKQAPASRRSRAR